MEPVRTSLGIPAVDSRDEDRTFDARGTFCGHWHLSMAKDVLLEAGATLESPDPSSRERQDVDRVTGTMSDDDFWQCIDLLDWSTTEPADVVELLVRHRAARPVEAIGGFHRNLSGKLFDLDRLEFARQIGTYSFGSAAGFSPDHFLDVRAAVVANGRRFYDEVVADPERMPKDLEFEELTTVAERAYSRKTGRTPLFLGAKPTETYSNTDGWRGVDK